MILQRDPRLNPTIRRYGCYLLSIFFLVNKYTNCEISTGMINEIFQILIDRGFMEEDAYIRDPAAIFDFMGLPVYYYDQHLPPNQDCKKDEIEILMFKKGGWRHFVTGDGKGHVAYDPWGVSRAVTEGRLISKRIFKLLR